MTEFRLATDGTMITKEMIFGHYSDTYKDAYGIRPRWIRIDEITIEEMEAEIDNLYKTIEQSLIDEDAWEIERQRKKDAKVLELIEMGAGDAETANRWLEDELYGRIDYEMECHLDRELDKYPEVAELW